MCFFVILAQDLCLLVLIVFHPARPSVLVGQLGVGGGSRRVIMIRTMSTRVIVCWLGYVHMCHRVFSLAH